MKVSINRISATRLGLVAAVAGLLFTTPVSAQEKQKEKEKKSYQKDFDKELESLEKARINLDKHRDIDMKKMEADIKRAMEKIDLDKAKMMADQALQKVDFEKIQREVAESMAAVAESQQHISKETQQAIREALDKAKQEINEQQHFNRKEIAAELEKAKEQIKLSQVDIQKSIKEATKSIDQARVELKNYQAMIYAMEADGLLDTKKDYTIEYKDGKLTINGNEQPDSVSDKFRKYFKNDRTTIRKEDGKMDIKNKY